ncbi:hypothetical protein HKK80_11595 [Halonotius sp. F2-221B]|uniref:hypothetical protein n=1 Tax=Halonotius sp. F2-221B TaxID=2731620 RepID=UPI00398BB65B
MDRPDRADAVGVHLGGGLAGDGRLPDAVVIAHQIRPFELSDDRIQRRPRHRQRVDELAFLLGLLDDRLQAVPPSVDSVE